MCYILQKIRYLFASFLDTDLMVAIGWDTGGFLNFPSAKSNYVENLLYLCNQELNSHGYGKTN